MSDSKKDLTGIHALEPVEPSESSGGSQDFAQDPPSEQVDSFESLEELPPLDAVSDPAPESPAPAGGAPEAIDFDAPLSFESPGAFDAAGEEPVSAPPIEAAGEDDFAITPDAAPFEEPPASELEAPDHAPALEIAADLEPQAASEPPPGPGSGARTMQNIREFAENQTVGTPIVQAAFPFSLRIDGKLSPEEKEKLLDVLGREGMGIREVDLEPQFQAGKILIPRISEYAAVVLIQALRGIRAKLWFSPSDARFAEASAGDSPYPDAAGAADVNVRLWQEPGNHGADSIAVSSLSLPPGGEAFSVIEVVTASATLKSRAVEAESTAEYQELLENLQREIQRRAFHKGATAVLNYSVSLASLGMPTHYRVTATGTAVKVTPKDRSPNDGRSRSVEQ